MSRHSIKSLLNKSPLEKRRAQLVISFLLALFALFFHNKNYIIHAITLCLFLTLPTMFLLRTVALLPTIKSRLIRHYWRLVVNTRKFYKLSIFTEFLLYLATLLIILHIPYVLFIDVHSLLLMQISIGIYALAALLDLKSRCEWMIKKTWARLAGKVLLAGVGTLAFYISSAMSKSWLTELTHSSSRFFPEITNILATLYTPITYLSIILLFVITMAMIEWLAIIIPMVFIMPLQIFAPKLTKRMAQRLITGKKRLSSDADKQLEVKKLIMLPRRFAPLILASLMISGMHSMFNISSPTVSLLAKKFLVELHYHTNYQCTNLPLEATVAELENGVVSVAYFGENNISFEEYKCEISSKDNQ
ncbi:Uncharacterised protein [Serratia grimesii]|jgi:hypothetical protein|uniref:hypothetical protein n=1 Tax=Serratia grimesii TaxID=82995 RepID=UPI00076F3AA1|nr:hypothetical protein [Serratia grimesii]CAI1085724.1 Uncharacterised protein [Serratia grimesii]CUW02740.1 Uncharacterised protein [Serratia grimesii]SMZ54939.1 Uncharacterised protein [Serratia grimesii]